MAEEDHISEATVKLKNELDSNIGETCYPKESRSSYAIVTRLYERFTQPKELQHAMQQWYQKANPAIEDLESLAPYLFGMKCFGSDSCAVCDAVTGLKARCKLFLECKIEHDAAEKAHASATEHHEKLMQHSPSRKGRAMKLPNTRLLHRSLRVSETAMLVLRDARIVSSAAFRVADRHNHVQSLLVALRAKRATELN